MANGLYAKARASFLSAGINWSTDTIKAVIIDVADYTVNLATDQYLSDIPAPARVATSPAFTSKTTTNGIADAADLTLATVTGDVSEAIVIYQDTGVATTSQLIAYMDTVAAGLPAYPNGGDIIIVFSASGIFKL